MLPRPPGPPLHPRWCQSAGGCGGTILQEGGGGGEGRRGRPFQEAGEGRRSTSMRQQALHVLELHRSTPRPPQRGGGGPFTFTFLSGGELPTSAGGARGGAPGGGASMGSHDVFLTSLQDSAYEGFAKFDSNSGTSQVRPLPPAPPGRGGIPPSRGQASRPGGGAWGQGGGLGRGGLPACLLGARGNEGADSLALSLSRQLSPVSCRRRPGPGPAEQDGAWPSGLPPPGPSPPPGGERGPETCLQAPLPAPNAAATAALSPAPRRAPVRTAGGGPGRGRRSGVVVVPFPPPTSSLPAPAPAPAGPRRRAGPAADAAAAGTRSPRCCCRSRRRCSTSRRSWTRRSWTSSSGC